MIGHYITMIFVTVGSQKFQFDRLLEMIDVLIEQGSIVDEVFAQIGYSTYVPRNYGYERFLDRTYFDFMIDKCDVVITHGGTGVIIGAVKKGKKVIAVPRLSRYGEHVDDHQLQLLHQFDELSIILACYDVANLKECYMDLEHVTFRPYQSNTMRLIESIDSFIHSVKI